MPPNPYVDEDLQALAEHARRFARGRVAPGFLERDQHRVLDRALLREMGALGFICPALPERLGGQGGGWRAGGGFSYLNVLGSLNGQILFRYGAPEVATPWLHQLAKGEAICALALTEPHAGSDAPPLPLPIHRHCHLYI